MINCSGITTPLCCFDPFTAKAIYFGWQEPCERHGGKRVAGIRETHVFRQTVRRRRSLFCHRAILGGTSGSLLLLKCLNKCHLPRRNAWCGIFDPKAEKRWPLQHNRLRKDFSPHTSVLGRDTDKWDSGDSRKKYCKSCGRFTKDNPSSSGWPVLPLLQSTHATELLHCYFLQWPNGLSEAATAVILLSGKLGDKMRLTATSGLAGAPIIGSVPADSLPQTDHDAVLWATLRRLLVSGTGLEAYRPLTLWLAAWKVCPYVHNHVGQLNLGRWDNCYGCTQ